MQIEERLKALLSATPATLTAVDAALTGKHSEVQGQSLRLLRMHEAAAMSGLSRCTLWRAIKEQRIRAVEIRRGSRRIPEAELLRFVQGQALKAGHDGRQ